MYGFKFGLGYGLIGGNTYNPLINYDWSTTTASGLRYLKDVGSAPTYNASMYFGRGAYLNGVDQTITVPINTTIQTALKRVNGVVTISETSQTLTNYVISGLGVHKDYYLFTRLLTTAEKDSYTNTPELFYAMAQADSTCVLNVPMCETDKFARNMKSYIIGSTNLFTSGFSVATNPTITDITNGYRIIKTSSDEVRWIALSNTAPVAETIIKVCFNFTLVAGSVYPTITGTYTSGGAKTLGTPYQVKEGYNELVVQSWANTRLAYLQIDPVASTFTWDFTNIIVNALSGIHSITNYTSSVRNNAKNLQYGLQTCKFVRDSLGVIQSASNYLECDTVGYADTGWVLQRSVGSFSIEFIQKHSNNGIFHISGRNESATQRFYFGENNAGRSVVRYLNTNPAYIDTESVSVGHTVISFDFDTNEMLVYFRGAYIGSYALTSFVDFSKSIILGYEANIVEKLGEAIRLFKVHNKVLTQEEVTKNYNSYRAKGLLS